MSNEQVLALLSTSNYLPYSFKLLFYKVFKLFIREGNKLSYYSLLNLQ